MSNTFCCFRPRRAAQVHSPAGNGQRHAMAMDPSMMDPSTEFGSMMQTAMKIKGHQMEQDRRRFETWPQFFQNSMWMQGPALELRLLPRA